MSEKNLLIVEDEELLVLNMKFLLGHLAGKIFTAYNGKEALDILRNNVIHCVITDVSMPIMNGVDFIKQARLEGFEQPFIFYSSFGDHELMREVALYGAYDFLRKPAFDGLEDVISRGLQEGFRRSQTAPTKVEEILSEYQQILDSISK